MTMDPCTNFRQIQPPTWNTLDYKLHKYGGWWTWNTNIQSCDCCINAFIVVVVWCFVPTSAHPLLFFWQVICPTMLECQFCMQTPNKSCDEIFMIHFWIKSEPPCVVELWSHHGLCGSLSLLNHTLHLTGKYMARPLVRMDSKDMC